MSKTALAVALTTLSALAAGLAYAGIPDDQGVIHGCYNASGQLRVVDAPGEACGAGQTSINWSQTGPTGPEGPPGPSAAFSGTDPGVLLPDELEPIAELAIPEAGSYVSFAKFYVFNTDIHGGATAFCELVAESDVDELEVGTGGDGGGDVPAASAALNVVHTFAGPGSVQLRCTGAGAALSAVAIRITAIKVGSLTDGPLD